MDRGETRIQWILIVILIIAAIIVSIILLRSANSVCAHEVFTIVSWASHAVNLGSQPIRSHGQGMIEYGLIIALVAVVVIATLLLVNDT